MAIPLDGIVGIFLCSCLLMKLHSIEFKSYILLKNSTLETMGWLVVHQLSWRIPSIEATGECLSVWMISSEKGSQMNRPFEVWRWFWGHLRNFCGYLLPHVNSLQLTYCNVSQGGEPTLDRSCLGLSNNFYIRKLKNCKPIYKLPAGAG